MKNFKQALVLLSCSLFALTCFAQSENYERYKGEIKVINDTIEYHGTFFIVSGINDTAKIIFKKGILYPAVLAGKQNGETLPTSKRTDTASTNNKTTLEWGSHYLAISNVREISSDISSSQVKVFKFWIFRKGIMNPSEYIFTLTNKDSNDSTDLSTFIIGSQLTSFKFVTIII